MLACPAVTLGAVGNAVGERPPTGLPLVITPGSPAMGRGVIGKAAVEKVPPAPKADALSAPAIRPPISDLPPPDLLPRRRMVSAAGTNALLLSLQTRREMRFTMNSPETVGIDDSPDVAFAPTLGAGTDVPANQLRS